MVGLVLVSHSARLAEGLAELVGMLAGPDVTVVAVGGRPDGGLGTDADGVVAALDEADGGDGVVVLGDLGSAILTIRDVASEGTAVSMRLADAPFVEGAVAAGVAASTGADLDTVHAAAEEARGAGKL